jgi:hypothetical protein
LKSSGEFSLERPDPALKDEAFKEVKKQLHYFIFSDTLTAQV